VRGTQNLVEALLGTKPQPLVRRGCVIPFFLSLLPWFRSATKMLGMDTLLPSLQLCIYTYCDDASHVFDIHARVDTYFLFCYNDTFFTTYQDAANTVAALLVVY